jgi:predicted secreted protein
VLTAQCGEPFTVELGAGPSSGYMWELPLLPPGVQMVGTRFEMPQGAAIGDGGTQIFALRADQKGLLVLRFVLKRRWESEIAQEREITVQVN